LIYASTFCCLPICHSEPFGSPALDLLTTSHHGYVVGGIGVDVGGIDVGGTGVFEGCGGFVGGTGVLVGRGVFEGLGVFEGRGVLVAG